MILILKSSNSELPCAVSHAPLWPVVHYLTEKVPSEIHSTAYPSKAQGEPTGMARPTLSTSNSNFSKLMSSQCYCKPFS